MHGRVFFSLALLVAAGCQSGDPITADGRAHCPGADGLHVQAHRVAA